MEPCGSGQYIMVTPKNKDHLINIVAVALCIAAPMLVIMGFLTVQNYFRLREELSAETARLDENLRGPGFPSRAAVKEARKVKDVLSSEFEASREFYLDLQRSVLDRKLLGSDEDGDPYLVAANFREMRDSLGNRTGNPNFLDLGEIERWAGERPSPDQFELLEKKVSLADALVQILTRHGRPVDSMVIADPYSLPERYRKSPEDGAETLECRIIPVNIRMNIPIHAMQGLLNDLLSVTPDAGKPFVALRSVEFDRPGDRPGIISLQLELNVFDFHMPEQG